MIGENVANRQNVQLAADISAIETIIVYNHGNKFKSYLIRFVFNVMRHTYPSTSVKQSEVIQFHNDKGFQSDSSLRLASRDFPEDWIWGRSREGCATGERGWCMVTRACAQTTILARFQRESFLLGVTSMTPHPCQEGLCQYQSRNLNLV